MPTTDHPIILFDAECVLCSANARFILRRDRARRFRLAAMQGEVGAALFAANGIDPADPDTLLLIEGGRVRRDSDAVLAIWSGLGWPWRAAVDDPALPDLGQTLVLATGSSEYRMPRTRQVRRLPSRVARRAC